MPSESIFLPALALAAGVLSFSSPCTLPLVPGYISYMAGVRAGRGRALTAALLFVAGFSAVFTSLGAAASGLGALLAENRILLERVAGAVIIVLGLVLVGLVKVPWLEREGRPLLERVRPGPKGALFLGVAFAFGWTPCIGPVLGSILVLAGSQQTAGSGALLLLVYSAGLGIPFLAAALLMDRFSGATQALRRHAATINVVAGVLLLFMGGLVASGRLQAFTAPVLELYARLKWPPI
ncbi:MAG: cytochrome c biogenesis CcdA family protein [Candidatus Dormibacterales bacterium]